MNSARITPARVGLLLYALLTAAAAAAAPEERAQGALPVGSAPAPVEFPHFPDRLHAVVWRNWGLLPPAQLGAVLGGSEEQIRGVAVSMGLPATPAVPPDMLRRGYITVLRRNWHLLPYDQLTELLGMTAGELAYCLREDDFLWVKLGSLKPRCERVAYAPPAAAARERAAEIRRTVQRYFGNDLAAPEEPRFQFVRDLSEPPPAAAAAVASSPPAADGARPRFLYSYFALYGDPLLHPELDPYPDGLLARLSETGVNGVWMHVVLRNLAPGGDAFPEFGADWQPRLETLRALVARAARHGIGIYLYINEPRAMPLAFFTGREEMRGTQEGDHAALCTSHRAVRQWLTESLAHVFSQVPGLAGVFTITASENLTNCASHGQRVGCPRCAGREEAEILAEVNAAIAAGVHRASPAARVIAWDWGWHGHGDAVDVIARLPADVALMSVSEWALPIERGGIRTQVGEYSISAVGPGPRATRHWTAAQARGLDAFAKMQVSATWELASLPYIPVPDLVARHCQHLAKAGVSGMMLSWTVGGYPSPNLAVAGRLDRDPAAALDDVLLAVARERYGAAAAPLVREAWGRFSKAFEEYPYSGQVVYQSPVQYGPANLLYLEPTGYSATMVGLPYDDLDGWRGPYPPETFAAQFQKLADLWAAGLEPLGRAASAAQAPYQNALAGELRVARAAWLHFQSVANQARFVLARGALTPANDTQQPAPATGPSRLIAELAAQEIELARELFLLARQDSRLGFEASNHYFYVPLDLVEKVINAQWVLDSARAGARD